MKRLLFLVLPLALISCDDDSVNTEIEKEEKNKFPFVGVISSVTGAPLADVEVKLYLPSEESHMITLKTNNSGVFKDSFAVGNYPIEIVLDGYDLLKDTIHLGENNDSLAFVLVGKASVSGHVVNSQTGEGLAGANVFFTRIDPSSGRMAGLSSSPEIIVLTDSNGDFNVNGAPTGNFNIEIKTEGFFTRERKNTLLVAGSNNLSSLTAVDIPERGEVRIILTWGEKPRDLDSHLTGPDGNGGRFHMYFDNKVPNQYISLDVDDTTGYGPETTTIYTSLPGTYRYSVNDYAHGFLEPETSGILISSSPTLVEVYDFTGLLNSFLAPPFDGMASSWRVFEMVVTDTGYTIESKSQYFTFNINISDTDNFRVGDRSKKATYNIDDF